MFPFPLLQNCFLKIPFIKKIWSKQFRYFDIKSSIQYPALISSPSKISVKENTIILKNARIQNYDNKIEGVDGIYIGKGCYLGFNTSLLNGGKILIGDNVLIASNVLISSENHGMDPESPIPYMDQPLLSKDVVIGDGVWIGQNVCVLPGVNIGEKTIIGAGAIVTKSIPSYCIAVGNPAHIIKKYNLSTHSWEKYLG